MCLQRAFNEGRLFSPCWSCLLPCCCAQAGKIHVNAECVKVRLVRHMCTLVRKCTTKVAYCRSDEVYYGVICKLERMSACEAFISITDESCDHIVTVTYYYDLAHHSMLKTIDFAKEHLLRLADKSAHHMRAKKHFSL